MVKVAHPVGRIKRESESKNVDVSEWVSVADFELLIADLKEDRMVYDWNDDPWVLQQHQISLGSGQRPRFRLEVGLPRSLVDTYPGGCHLSLRHRLTGPLLVMLSESLSQNSL